MKNLSLTRKETSRSSRVEACHATAMRLMDVWRSLGSGFNEALDYEHGNEESSRRFFERRVKMIQDKYRALNKSVKHVTVREETCTAMVCKFSGILCGEILKSVSSVFLKSPFQKIFSLVVDSLEP